METFQVIHPTPILAPFIKHYWFMKITDILAEQVRIVPSGNISLIFHRGNRIFSATEDTFQPQAFLCGHETVYNDLEYTGQIDMICVVFQPVGAKAFFNLPINEVNGIRVDIHDLNDQLLTDLQKSLEDAQTDEHCVLLIEQFLLNRIKSLADYNLRRIDTAIRQINTQQTELNILAEKSCLSPRQFNRVFTEYVGTGPKEFQRIVRFQRTLFVLQSQPEINMAQLAAACGYYDQPHLIKEFKIFSGYTPIEYIATCAPYSDYFS